MSDNPEVMKSILLEHADPEIWRQFDEMLKEQLNTHELQKTHRC